MKLDVQEEGLVRLQEVFNPIVLQSENGETLSICMRDGGFEFIYGSVPYSASGGSVTPMRISHGHMARVADSVKFLEKTKRRNNES